MGNNTSQPCTESDDGPQYRYHETVLRDAQSRLPSAEYLSDDEEQFYSAEEGDSSRSVTPERRRPESSSGGESENSEIESPDEEDDVSPPDTSASGQRLALGSQRSCGQCSVSMVQEHDSIGPELETVVRGGNLSVVSWQEGSAQGSHKRELSTPSLQDHKSPKKLKLRTSLFQPICSGNRQERLMNQLRESVSPAKRKILSNSGEENVSPAKKPLTESPYKRMRLGYFDSSESEDDDGYTRSRSRRKRQKLNELVNKRPRPVRKSCESSSEDDSHKRLRNSKQTDGDRSDSDEDHSEAVGDEKGRVQDTKMNGFPNNSETSHSVQNIRGRTLRARRTSNISSNNNAPSIYPHPNKSEDHTRSVQRAVEQPGALRIARNVEVSDRTLRAGSVTRSSSEAKQSQSKMGDLGVRNALGKILPLHQFKAPAAPQSPLKSLDGALRSPQSNLNRSETSAPEDIVPNISKRLRRASGAFVLLHKLVPSLSQSSPQQGGQAQYQKTNSSPSQHQEEADDRQHQSESIETFPAKSGSAASKRSFNENPFQDIELTPPSKVPTVESDTTQASSTPAESLSVECMETDDSFRVSANGVASSPMEVNTGIGERPIARAKRRFQGKTVAERFRNFWNKKNIGSNLKSLFAKPTASPPSKSSASAPQRETNHGLNQLSGRVNALSDPNNSTPVTFLSSESPVRLPIVSSPTKSSSQPLHTPPFGDHYTPPILPPSGDHYTPPISPPSSSQRPQNLNSGLSTPQTLGAQTRGDFAGVAHGQVMRRKSTRLATPSEALTTDGSNLLSTTGIVKLLPQTSPLQALHAQLGDCLTVSVSLGELADQSADGLVNWTDGHLTHKVTQCSQAVAARAGALLLAGCADYLENKGGPLEPPDVLTTLAGGRFEPTVQSILHVVSPAPPGSPPVSRRRNNQTRARETLEHDEGARSLLRDVYTNCLRFAEGRLGLSSLAFPLIGLDHFSVETCVQCFCDSVLLFLQEHGFPSSSTSPNISLSSVHLVIPDARTTDAAADVLQSCLSRLSSPEAARAAVSGSLEDKSMLSESRRLLSGEKEDVSSPSRAETSSEMDDFVVQGKRNVSGRPRVKRPRL